MAKTQDIKRRIRSIGNTMQLTRAMKMVSAAKLRRAQERIMQGPAVRRTSCSRPALAGRARQPGAHPLLQAHGDATVELFVLTGDKGLCGAFNANIIRKAENFAEELQRREALAQRRGQAGPRVLQPRRNVRHRRDWVDVFRDVAVPAGRRDRRRLIERYIDRRAGRDLPRLQRVQVGDPVPRPSSSVCCRSSRRSRRERDVRRLHLRARAPRSCSARCCRTTSSRSSSRPCSSRWRPSTPPA